MSEAQGDGEMEPGWLDRQLKSVAADVAAWPTWMRREAGIEDKTMTKFADLTATEWRLDPGFSTDREYMLCRVGQIDGPDRYAIRRSSGMCMNRVAVWEREPMPSSRDAKFMKRCRFDTPEAALSVWDEWVKTESRDRVMR